jgi:uncharacterized damage-inducible protein DinB
MDALVRHLQIQARANRLMNHRLHQAMLQLAPDAFKAPRVSFFPSLWQTLNHILIVDWYYVDALEANGRGAAAFANETPYDTMAELAQAQAAVDARLMAYCDALQAQDLTTSVALDRGKKGILYDPVCRLLPHVFMHQTHHRGQAHAMLSGTHVKPPQLDEFFMATDAQFRTVELAQLGMTEADLTP